MDKRQFILDTLLPFLQDPSTCAMDSNGNCRYLTEDGRKCALGKHIRPEAYLPEMEGYGALMLDRHGMDILTDEAKQYNFTIDDWYAIQNIHDGLANRRGTLQMTRRIKELEEKMECEFPELLAALSETE